MDASSNTGDMTKRTINGVTIGSTGRPEVFVHVEQHEQHEMAAFEDKQNSGQLFPDAYSEHSHTPTTWTGEQRGKSLKSSECIV